MNEQKDKLLINLVEPGRIGRTPFNSFFSLSSLFRMGELVKKKRIDGGCGGSGNEAWLGWIVFWWVIGGGSRRQPAKREDEQAKRNVFLLFHLHQLWMKRIIDWEMEWRDEIEERTAQPQSNNPIKWIFSLLIHLMELLGGVLLNYSFFFHSSSILFHSIDCGKVRASNQLEKKNNSILFICGLWAQSAICRREIHFNNSSIVFIHSLCLQLINERRMNKGMCLVGCSLFSSASCWLNGAESKEAEVEEKLLASLEWNADAQRAGPQP